MACPRGLPSQPLFLAAAQQWRWWSAPCHPRPVRSLVDEGQVVGGGGSRYRLLRRKRESLMSEFCTPSKCGSSWPASAGCWQEGSDVREGMPEKGVLGKVCTSSIIRWVYWPASPPRAKLDMHAGDTRQHQYTVPCRKDL